MGCRGNRLAAWHVVRGHAPSCDATRHTSAAGRLLPEPRILPPCRDRLSANWCAMGWCIACRPDPRSRRLRRSAPRPCSGWRETAATTAAASAVTRSRCVFFVEGHGVSSPCCSCGLHVVGRQAVRQSGTTRQGGERQLPPPLMLGGRYQCQSACRQATFTVPALRSSFLCLSCFIRPPPLPPIHIPLSSTPTYLYRKPFLAAPWGLPWQVPVLVFNAVDAALPPRLQYIKVSCVAALALALLALGQGATRGDGGGGGKCTHHSSIMLWRHLHWWMDMPHAHPRPFPPTPRRTTGCIHP